MKLFALLPCYTVGFLAALSNAITLPAKRDASTPAVVHFPIQRKIAPIQKNGLNRREPARKLRRAVVDEKIQNRGILYTASINVGTPPQTVTLQVDTGSSDFWIVEATNGYCTDPAAKPLCQKYGTYDSASSTSRMPVDGYFGVTYVDGSGASGGFVTDTVSFGGYELTKFQFGEAYSSGTALGVIGLGYQGLEAQQEGSPLYPTLTQALLSQQLINLNAYSIWLNDRTSSDGTILFGGVDMAKYAGKLTTLKTQLGPYRPELGVQLNSVTFKENRVVKPVTPILDTGAEYTYLPEEMTDMILKALGGVYNDVGTVFVECSLATSKETVDFELGAGDTSVIIRLPLSSIVYPSISGPLPPKNKDGVELCTIGISKLSGSDDPGGLGDSFLRSAYVVVDLTHNQLSFAQAVYTSDSKIVEIPVDGVAAIN
ncbi:hypothetical protein MMC07_003882 [Pseudocyphellaria aurata]|nr:hypothetical protein [Pseudocyphellaria aurata]